MKSQQRMPSTDAASCVNFLSMKSANSSMRPSRAKRSRSANRSTTNILQPSCSPKYAMLLPTTGPRSMSTGSSREVRQPRNLRRAFVEKRGSESAGGGKTAASDSLLRDEIRSSRPNDAYQLGADALSGGCLRHRWRRHGRGSGGRLYCGLRLFLLLLRRTLALHVDAALEVRAFGNGNARRHEVAFHRSVVADVDLLRGGDVAVHLAKDDHHLREHLRLDFAVRPDRQDMITQLDRPFDVALDRQVFAAVQLALDDDRFADIHDVLLHKVTRFRSGCRGRCRHWRRWDGRLSAGGADGFITLPH